MSCVLVLWAAAPSLDFLFCVAACAHPCSGVTLPSLARLHTDTSAPWHACACCACSCLPSVPVLLTCPTHRGPQEHTGLRNKGRAIMQCVKLHALCWVGACLHNTICRSPPPLLARVATGYLLSDCCFVNAWGSNCVCCFPPLPGVVWCIKAGSSVATAL